ncbi:cystatin-A1-like [Eleutherodactylus coqui]|uniref:cystatin-A1-like n=1 Tax=Eleutherodactylus coqui TaxID=57060 RepID=UPI00346273C4
MAGTTNEQAGEPIPHRVGGFGDEKPATEEIQEIADSVKYDFLKQSGANATKFVALYYQSQVVAGTNYRIKVDIGGDCYCLEIFVPLPYTGNKPELTSYKKKETCKDVCHS